MSQPTVTVVERWCPGRCLVFSDNTVESQRCHNQQLQWWRDGVPVGGV